MDEQKNHVQDEKGYVCTCCAHYGHGHWLRGAALRIIFALIVAFGIFWFGVKIGEFKANFENYGGFPRERYYMMGGYGPGSTTAVPLGGAALPVK